MKIQIKDLKPNPFRNIEHYPIDRDKVQTLKDSIEETGFWDNILARQFNGEIQIAYGHHRLEALKQVFKPTDEIDITIRNLSCPEMLRIMANENMEQWGISGSIVIETIKAVMNYLNNELSKYETWEEIRSGESARTMLGIENGQAFAKLKDAGVGRTTILDFLGPPWKHHMIKDALNTINDEKISEEAIKILGSYSKGETFKRAIKKVNKSRGKKIEPEEQIELAKKIKEKIDDNQSTGHSRQEQRESMTTMLIEELDDVDQFDATLTDLEADLKKIENETRKLTTSILTMNGRLHELGIEQLQSMGVVFAVQEFSELNSATKRLVKYFGFELKQIEQ